MSQESGEAPIIRDRRRIDPQTGEVRSGERQTGEVGPDAAAPTTTPSGSSEPAPSTEAVDDALRAEPSAGLRAEPSAGLRAELDERTADLQRLQAEYTNYRRRVERDREAVAEQALASVLIGLLPVLDDIDRAKAHGESSQGFVLLADGLDATLTKLGLQRFGEVGEPFDPTVHEALTHAGESPDVDGPVCSEIYQPGFRVGERILRPARVAVVDPAAPAAAVPNAAFESNTTDEPVKEH